MKGALKRTLRRAFRNAAIALAAWSSCSIKRAVQPTEARPAVGHYPLLHETTRLQGAAPNPQDGASLKNHPALIAPLPDRRGFEVAGQRFGGPIERSEPEVDRRDDEQVQQR